jgi:AcrR family transcriptional regulator
MPVRKRSDHWERRRSEILARGAELFAAQGYDRTTLQDIMDGFDTSAASFYYYFGDKVELLTEMLDRIVSRAERRLRWLDEQPLPPWAKLRMMVAEHTATIAGDPALAAVLFEELQMLPEPVRSRTYARTTAYTERLEEILAAGVEAGEFPPLDVKVAMSLVLGMGNHSYRWFAATPALGPEELGELAAAMAMRALGARPEAAHGPSGLAGSVTA